MNVEILTLCDAAFVDAQGKLDILGSIREILVPQPGRTGWPLAVAAKLRFESNEVGPKQILIYIANGAGVIATMLNIPHIVQLGGQPTMAYTFATPPQPIQFPNIGEYLLCLKINGVVEAGIPIYIRMAPPVAWSI